MTAAIALHDVSKRYRLGTSQGSLRDLFEAGIRRLVPGRKSSPNTNYLWALNGLTFEVPQGSVLGVVGSNGAGKTTLLKLLCGITRPTRGWVDVNGRMSSLIELGAGFHPDLTGRENIYLNGAILGLSQKEIAHRFDRIVEFAGIDQFIDTPVKRYSSGMYARLGFSVAAHAEPDLLLVDEVLAVGDGPFQRKCYEFMQSFIKSDRTVVFVSHNMAVIEQLCKQVLWIDRGQMKLLDVPERVLSAYFDAMDKQLLEMHHSREILSEHLQLAGLRITNTEGIAQKVFHTGDDIIVQLKYHAPQPIRRPHFCLGITGPEGGAPIFLASMLIDGQAPEQIQGTGIISCRFHSVPLQPKAYHIWGEVWDEDQSLPLLRWQRIGAFLIDVSAAQMHSLTAGGLRHLRADAPVYVPYEWNQSEDG